MYDMIGGSAMGDKFARYVCYLRSMFDEIAVDLGSLDRFSPFDFCFPMKMPSEATRVAESKGTGTSMGRG